MPITYFVAFLISLMVTASLTLAVRHLALRHGVVDRGQGSRRVHATPTPRLGGIAVVLGFFAPLVGLLVVDSWVGIAFRSNTPLVFGLFGGGLAIALLGLYDDLRGSGAPLKLAVQLAVGLVLYRLGVRIELLANPFGVDLDLGVLSLPFTLLWLIGVVNAMNLIDGLDGLAAGVAFFAVATNFLLAISRGDLVMSLMMATLGGAILGFLIFNFNPASIFMGDTGSMFLGFVLAVSSVVTSTKSGTAVAMLVPIISLGLPIMDTLLAMIRRTLIGRPMFAADKEHIHHRLMSRLQLSHRNAVLVLYALCCLFGLTALGLSFANSAQSALLLAGIAVVVVVLMRKLGYLNPRAAIAGAGQKRRRNVALRTVVKEVTESVRAAQKLSELWESLRPLSWVLDLSRLELHLRPSGAEGDVFQFAMQRGDAGASLPCNLRFDVRGGPRTVGTLEVSWTDGRETVNRDEELALELIADAVGDAAARLQAHAEADPHRLVVLKR